MYLLALACLLVLLPGAWRQVPRYPGLWLLAVSAGLTNVCFNWAVTVGDVVRVVLLFYLMPAWSVLLAWRFLGEVPTPLALLRLLLAFGGGGAGGAAARHAADAAGPGGCRPWICWPWPVDLPLR